MDQFPRSRRVISVEHLVVVLLHRGHVFLQFQVSDPLIDDRRLFHRQRSDRAPRRHQFLRLCSHQFFRSVLDLRVGAQLRFGEQLARMVLSGHDAARVRRRRASAPLPRQQPPPHRRQPGRSKAARPAPHAASSDPPPSVFFLTFLGLSCTLTYCTMTSVAAHLTYLAVVLHGYSIHFVRVGTATAAAARQQQSGDVRVSVVEGGLKSVGFRPGTRVGTLAHLLVFGFFIP